MENKIKHTPGEWKISNNKYTEQIFIHRGDELYPISFLNYEHLTGRNNRARQEANAKLIAAAPELLEALKELCGVQAEEFEVRRKAYDKAMKIINKTR